MNRKSYTAPEVLDPNKSSPFQTIVRSLLSLGFIILIFGYVIPSFVDYNEIWKAVQGLSIEQVIIITIAFFISELAKAAPTAILIEKLSLFRSFIANEAAEAFSNAVPGPSGTAMRYVILRSWGHSIVDFGRSTVVINVVNTLYALIMPLIALIPLTFNNDISSKTWIVVLGGAIISIIGIILVVAIARSEKFARKVGTLFGRAYTWLLGIIHKPTDKDVGNAVVEFREETINIMRKTGYKLIGALTIKYVALFVILDVCFRATGVDREILPTYVVFAGFCLARMLTMIEVTPGGIGVNELVYSAIFIYITDGVMNDQIVAGVLLFRGITVIGPIVCGAFSYGFFLLKKSWHVPKEEISTSD